MIRRLYLWFTRYSRLKAEHEALQSHQRELISIFQQLEKDCRVVVNRNIPCLVGLASWRNGLPPLGPSDHFPFKSTEPKATSDFKPFNPRKGFKEWRNEWERKNNTIAPRLERRAKEYEGIPTEGEPDGRKEDIG